MRNNLLFIGLILLFFSCGNEKIVQLPEIENAKITKVFDVSPAYIFYDETKQDSVDLNRKNLIISSNWLFNVDKRLTLAQAIPKIKFLQDKKRNAKMHKNENARNYFTCNDTSIKNLGFIDFTDVEYRLKYKEIEYDEFETNENTYEFSITIKSLNEILIDSILINSSTEINGFYRDIKTTIDMLSKNFTDHGIEFFTISLSFNRNLSFQDYITIKSKLINLDIENVILRKFEYIY